MALEIYNSLSRNKEVFEPINPPYVGMYVCGPTVSGESHLGHARPYITFDVVFRYLRHLGYKVRYVRNITDAGHFEEEGREAEDKITKKAQLERLEPMELVQKYTNLFHWAFHKFNTLDPTIEPTATGHIVEQIEMIKILLRKGFAYEVNGSVYFDVEKYAKNYDYGKLSGRVVEDLLETTRVLESQDEKKNKADFALWKAAPPKHIMRWASPWGDGFPGWHIECSAMATKYLGPYFDIHGGGMDLLFPHHESEIAQSTICNNHAPVKYWMHNNMITINGRKMGKSYNNVISLSQLFGGNHPAISRAFSPMTVRFFILQTHYRSVLDFSGAALEAAEKGLRRLFDAYEILKASSFDTKGAATDNELDLKVNNDLDQLQSYLDDDFNTAKVLAGLFEVVPVINSIKDKIIPADALSDTTYKKLKEYFHLYLEEILGLKNEWQVSEEFSGVMELLASIRQDARTKKDFYTSDKIRNELNKIGIDMKDEKSGEISWKLK